MCKLCCVEVQGGDGGAAYVKLHEEHMYLYARAEHVCAFIFYVTFVT